MKSQYWIILLAAVFVLCAVGGFALLAPGEDATRAEILSNGQVIRTVDLSIDQSFTVPSSDGGYNTITVSGGAIAVTAASCPDHYCARRGYCSGGADIVCLPNKLVIRFLGEQDVDIALG